MATEDYLDIDPPINGQNYVCLSFVSLKMLLKTVRLQCKQISSIYC